MKRIMKRHRVDKNVFTFELVFLFHPRSVKSYIVADQDFHFWSEIDQVAFPERGVAGKSVGEEMRRDPGVPGRFRDRRGYNCKLNARKLSDFTFH